MKNLIVKALFTSLLACSIASPSAKSAETNEGIQPGSSEESGLHGYDQPLMVNLDNFKNVARERLVAAFGESVHGDKIVYKDSFVVGGPGVLNDHTALFYLVKADSKLLQESNVYAAYIIKTDGTEALTLVNFNERTKETTILFPAYIVSVKKEIGDEGAKQFFAELETRYPSLYVQMFCGSLLPNYGVISAATTGLAPVLTEGRCGDLVIDEQTNEPVYAEQKIKAMNLVPDHVKDLESVLGIFETDDRIDFVEPDTEFRNPGIQATPLVIKAESTGTEIDLNALRTVTIDSIRKGDWPMTRPSLPAPFGPGPIKNPLPTTDSN